MLVISPALIGISIMKETISFISACVRFFGTLPDQTKIQFGMEIKKLTPKDREEMKPELEEILGVSIA